MNVLSRVARAGRYKIDVAKGLLTGRPPTATSFGTPTLDASDVKVAREWLQDRSRWDDEGVVRQFEEAFASWNGSRHAFVFMGARVALSACVYALDLHSGDEVLIPGYTCVAVPNAFRYAGVNLTFCDIELDTYGLAAEGLEARLTAQTKAVLLHHLYGLVSRDYQAVLAFAREKGLPVIEDCAQATGAILNGVNVGNGGDLAIYSSERSKLLNTVLGGLATTNDGQLARRLRAYAERAPTPDDSWMAHQLESVVAAHMRDRDPSRWLRGELVRLKPSREVPWITPEEVAGMKPPSYGRRMRAPIAALGLNQLAKLDEYNGKRREGAMRWAAWCDDNGHAKPVVLPGSSPVFLRYPVLADPAMKRDTSWGRRDLGVQVGVWFVSKTHPAPGKSPAARMPTSPCSDASTSRPCCDMVGKGKAVIALPTDLRQMVATRLPCPVGYRLRYDFQKRRLTHLGP